MMDTIFDNNPSYLLVKEAEFSTWLVTAKPGTALRYHDGFLILDVAKGAAHLSTTERKELVAVARLAWWASEQRLIHLVQRRLGPGRFAYLAIMRRATPRSARRVRGSHPAE